MSAPTLAVADGKRDLEDGVAFYESLDIDRAKARLEAASEASDLQDKDRARAFLYLGMLQFDLGDGAAADAAFEKALQLDFAIVPPDGTSPKTIAAIDAVKGRVGAAGVAEPGGVKPPPPPAPPPDLAPPPPAPPPDIAPPPPAVTDVTKIPPETEDGISPWVWVGAGAGVAAAVVVVVILASGSSGTECQTGGGGCLLVNFQ